MSGSFTETAQKHDYYGKEEGGADAVRFSSADRSFARKRFDEYETASDILWNKMFDDIQEETQYGDAEVYLLIQKTRTTRR